MLNVTIVFSCEMKYQSVPLYSSTLSSPVLSPRAPGDLVKTNF